MIKTNGLCTSGAVSWVIALCWKLSDQCMVRLDWMIKYLGLFSYWYLKFVVNDLSFARANISLSITYG